MLKEASARMAVVTICTPSFIPGTMVMIYSYLKYNEWFKGDFIILVEELNHEMEKYLSYMPRVKFHTVGSKLLDRSTKVSAADHTGKVFKSHFFSLELFNIQGYDKLFYVDSDMLILGDLSELFMLDAPMVCVGDSFFYKDFFRDGVNYNRYDPAPGEDTSRLWADCFNAGLILFDKQLVTSQNYNALLQMVSPQGYSTQAMRLQDQMIQNIYFRGQYTMVSAKYNYRLGIADQILEKDGVRPEDAIIIHYTARKKPWLFREALDRLLTNKKYLLPFQLWQKHWVELLEQLHHQHA